MSETKRSDLHPCDQCGNREGEECLVDLAPDMRIDYDRLSGYLLCVGFGYKDDEDD